MVTAPLTSIEFQNKNMAKSKANTIKSKTKANSTVKKPLTKTEIFSDIADMTGMTKKQVASVFEALGNVAHKNLSKRGPQVFTVPGFVKFKVVHKAAKKARKGVNPFTGEEMMFKAKPAHNVVKATPLKVLKDMAA